MLLNIITFFIILCILVLVLTATSRKCMYIPVATKEGFINETHKQYVEENINKYNPLGSLINLSDPPIQLNPENQDRFEKAILGVDPVATNSTYTLKPSALFTVPDNVPGNFLKAAECEKKAAECGAFDDPEFAKNCGISFDVDGMDSKGKKHMGGLFITERDRQNQLAEMEELKKSGLNPFVVPRPSLGKAANGKFALTKDQCIIVKDKLDCQQKQSFGVNNCFQCLTSQEFSYVMNPGNKIPFKIKLYGKGKIRVESPGNKFNLPQRSLSDKNATELQIPDDSEGIVFSVIVEKENNDSFEAPFVVGYLEGNTISGAFKLDFAKLIEVDQVSGAKAKLGGSNIVDGFRSSVVIPATGQNYMNLATRIPFSFMSLSDFDTKTCQNGPVLTKESSALFLESDPCFNRSNSKGNYSLDCLQSRFISVGGTRSGRGFPSTKEKADALMKDANGNLLDINDIINIIYDKVIQGSTGKTKDGIPLSIEQWNEMSMWAFGKQITTPCDGREQDGSLSKDCLVFLYNNEGIGTNIGATYSLPRTDYASMIGKDIPNTYCRPGTRLDPNTESGIQGLNNMFKGPNAVEQAKSYYDNIYRTANNNNLSNDQRRMAVASCYDILLDQDRPSNRSSSIDLNL